MAASGSTLGKPGSMPCLPLCPDISQKLSTSQGSLWRPVQEDAVHTVVQALSPPAGGEIMVSPHRWMRSVAPRELFHEVSSATL